MGAAKAVICCANLLQKAKLLRFSLLRFSIVEKLCKMALSGPFCVRFLVANVIFLAVAARIVAACLKITEKMMFVK